MTGLDVCRNDAFPQARQAVRRRMRHPAPLNSPRPEDLDHGFRVLAIDTADGTAEVFVRNSHPGPASQHGSGGIERPVDVKFGPGGSLYVLDFGVSTADPQKQLSYGHTGVLWRVTHD